MHIYRVAIPTAISHRPIAEQNSIEVLSAQVELVNASA
jgi:hypothetical protein